MKDQPTEAAMHPLNVNRYGLPSTAFNHGNRRRPFAVQQRKGVVQRKGVGGVVLQGVNRQNKHKPSPWMTDPSGAAQARFKETVSSDGAVRISSIGRVEHKASHGTVPSIGKNLLNAGCVATYHAGMRGGFAAVCPNEVGLSPLNHLRMNVNAE